MEYYAKQNRPFSPNFSNFEMSCCHRVDLLLNFNDRYVYLYTWSFFAERFCQLKAPNKFSLQCNNKIFLTYTFNLFYWGNEIEKGIFNTLQRFSEETSVYNKYKCWREVLYDGIKCARWIKTNDGLWVLEIPLSETVLQNLCGQL